MNNTINGIHHITAIADNAKRNFDFYTKVLGLRFVKRTVNFDDPGTYHFYFGDEKGTPGTILTFFPWEGIGKGSTGTGMATEINYSVPKGSLEFWAERFKEMKITHDLISGRFDERILSFTDPDGLNLTLTEPEHEDRRIPWITGSIPESSATTGFYGITLNVRKMEPTANILTDVFGYSLQKQDGNRYRFKTDAIDTANVVDIIETPDGRRGHNAAGTNHHVAFRVKDDDILMEMREKVERRGLNATPKIDRNYFFSVYFREPGGVLFEMASDNPGFAVDEPVAELGTHLMLPPQYEKHRAQIEKVLPVLS